jgi:UDP-2-acetamido-2-deoxy-ribo-hexuluronate aminotransferase
MRLCLPTQLDPKSQMISFIDLRAQYQVIQEQVELAVLRVLRSGQYIMGPEVELLEQRLSEFVGVRQTVSCASGTDALVIALMAYGVAPGDAVFTTPFTFVATAEAIALVGATPVFVDVQPDTFNMDPAGLSRALEALSTDDPTLHPLPRRSGDAGPLNPRGIIPVDLFGLPADYNEINRTAADRGLFVIEDAAQSFGAMTGNSVAGSLAEVGCTSFFPAKPLGCFGDGGALFTDDDRLADLFRSIRVHGQGNDRYENVRIGITGRLDSVQAAVLLVKLAVFPKELEQRQRVAARYTSAIIDARLALQTPRVPAGHLSSWAQFTVLAADHERRGSLRDKLAAAGLPSAIYYPKPLHLQAAFTYLGYAAGDFPIAEDLSQRVLSLPMHPYLTDDQIDQIVDAMAA